MNPRRRKRIDPNTAVLLKHIGVGMLVLGGVVLLIAVIWYGTRLPGVTLSVVEARGGETIDAAMVEQLVQEQLEGEYIGLVPRRFVWLYPEADVLAAIETVERIHNVQVHKVKGRELRITYDEYVPQALWCEAIGSDDCVFLDEHGYAFGKAPALSGGTFLRFVTSGRETVVGESVAAEDGYLSLLLLQQLLQEQGWFISHIETDQVGDAFLKVVGGGELKVTVADGSTQVVENLLVVLSSDDFAHIKPGNFQYIDLRFGNKVFVNEELAVPKGETASSTASSTALEELE